MIDERDCIARVWVQIILNADTAQWIATLHPSPNTNSDTNTLDLATTSAEIVDLVECKCHFLVSFSFIFLLLNPIHFLTILDKSPGPPSKTGYHRYVFVLLAGDNTNLTAPSKRQHWGTDKTKHGVRDWAKKEGLEVIGANWFIEKNKKQ